MDIKSNARKQNLIISQYPKVLLFNIYFCLFIRWSLTDNGFCSTINVITMFCSLIYIKLSPDWSPKLLFRLKLLKCHGIHSRPFKASLIAYVSQIVFRKQTWMSSNLKQRWKNSTFNDKIKYKSKYGYSWSCKSHPWFFYLHYSYQLVISPTAWDKYLARFNIKNMFLALILDLLLLT